MENRMTICNMTIEGGGRAGMIAPDETTFEYVRGRPGAPSDFDAAVERWRELPTDEGAELRHRGRDRRRRDLADGHLGDDPGHGRRRSPTGCRTRPRMDSPADREAAERALAYMGLRAGHADDRDPARPGLHRLLHQLADRRPARGRRRSSTGRKVADSSCAAMVVPGSAAGQGAGRGRGPRRGLPRGRLRVARGRLLDVPGHEPRHPAAEGERCASTSNRNFEGRQGKGGRTHLVSPKMAAAAADRGPLRRHQGLELDAMDRSTSSRARSSVLDRADVDTDQIIPKQFLKRVERTGFGEFLFYDWIRDGEIELEPNPILVAGRNFGSRLLPRARRLGARGLRLRGGHRALVRGHLLLQLHQERAAAGDPRRGALPRRRRGRRGPDRPRRPDRHLRRRSRSSSRSTPDDQAPPAQRPRRHRHDPAERRARSTRSRRPAAADRGPVTTAL